ncbi:AAA family ATPase [Acerihabitans sp. KWT182]|uniref:AAA family ATPase n=1 Tax=Acerihabitans sp. KWT182 TaxID=3157919 RepID=A0AAU7Q7W2_9GAMM
MLPNVQDSTLAIKVTGRSEKNALDSNHLFENPLYFTTATWHGLALPEWDAVNETTHQKIRDRLYQLSWLTLSGNVPAATLADRLCQGTQLRLALVAGSGSGKSTTAELLREAFRKRGLLVSIEKLAQPLYSLQQAYFNELAQTIDADVQHQHLMEKIADNLRMLEPRSLINHLFARLQRNKSDVILTDDLRDKKIDWPALIEHGYVVIRVLCDESIRRQRLNARQDMQSQITSTLDTDIRAIEADITLDNNGDINQLRDGVNALVERLLRARDE